MANMKVGEEGTISSFTDGGISKKLSEMGCFLGERICLSNIAPLGDPIAIKVSDMVLSLRKSEAVSVIVSLK